MVNICTAISTLILYVISVCSTENDSFICSDEEEIPAIELENSRKNDYNDKLTSATSWKYTPKVANLLSESPASDSTYLYINPKIKNKGFQLLLSRYIQATQGNNGN